MLTLLVEPSEFSLLAKSYHMFSVMFICVGLCDVIGTCGSSFIILTQIVGSQVYFSDLDWIGRAYMWSIK